MAANPERRNLTTAIFGPQDEFGALGTSAACLGGRGRVRQTFFQAGQPLPAAMSSIASDQVARHLGQNAVICAEGHGAA